MFLFQTFHQFKLYYKDERIILGGLNSFRIFKIQFVLEVCINLKMFSTKNKNSEINKLKKRKKKKES